ncbi:DUF6973 domain-containing protein [Nocardioides sp. zg-1228]|uniref:DUF6973 domain-containing protein n=1 Tax=Nocardioides sp. zg-1228 TaxID=2763008 RepID=UPI0016423F97|nr:hypothetical protein [Nocardioides sp. zg-1228]MBC2933268.1 hypothetical protein [Nocardioides sp. zg-1228]QSF56567.1 hypothetical protein JX575_13115 [Nocardioides sp. zg-1228]
MALGDIARQAIHAGTVVPRLYVAAVQAGLGPAGALEVLRLSRAALQIAAAQGRGVPGRANAMRHFMWQAVLTARFGVETARAIATAQESGSSARHDSRVDEHNNAVGQEYGATNAAELGGTDAMRRLVPVALAKWDSGELVWVTRR